MALKKYSLRQRTGFTYSHVKTLCCSHDYFLVFGDDETKAKELMRAAWPELRAAAFLMQEKHDSGTLPMGFFRFDESCPECYRHDFFIHDRAKNRELAAEIRRLGLVPAQEEINSQAFIDRVPKRLRPKGY